MIGTWVREIACLTLSYPLSAASRAASALRTPCARAFP